MSTLDLAKLRLRECVNSPYQSEVTLESDEAEAILNALEKQLTLDDLQIQPSKNHGNGPSPREIRDQANGFHKD